MRDKFSSTSLYYIACNIPSLVVKCANIIIYSLFYSNFFYPSPHPSIYYPFFYSQVSPFLESNIEHGRIRGDDFRSLFENTNAWFICLNSDTRAHLYHELDSLRSNHDNTYV